MVRQQHSHCNTGIHRNGNCKRDQSIEQGKAVLETGNRAWVPVNQLVTHDSSAEEASLNWEISIARDVILRNFGQTPASLPRAECHMQVIGDFPTTTELHLTPSNKSVSVLSPGGDFWVVPTAIMRSKLADRAALMQGKGKLLLFCNAYGGTWFYFWDTSAGGFIQGPLHNQVT
jgi:hypothetical protein